MLKTSRITITFFIVLLSMMLGNVQTATGSGQCTVICPNSGVYCVHQNENGTTWSEKGENDAAVITGPCDQVEKPID